MVNRSKIQQHRKLGLFFCWFLEGKLMEGEGVILIFWFFSFETCNSGFSPFKSYLSIKNQQTWCILVVFITMACGSWDWKNMAGPPILALSFGHCWTKLFSKNLRPLDYFGSSDMSREQFYAIKFYFGQLFQNSDTQEMRGVFLLIFRE